MSFVALLKKTITFRRLPSKHVKCYEVYAAYKDDNYDSGIRNELLDIIDNPDVPNPRLIRIPLAYNDNATWELPDDAFLDRDHQFRLFLNNFIMSSAYFNFNRLLKLITFDTVAKTYTLNDKMELEYYQDIITKEYMLESDCVITVKPIFLDTYNYGDHNIII